MNKKISTRILTLILALLMILSAGQSALAFSESSPDAVDREALKALLYENFLTCTSAVDIQSFALAKGTESKDLIKSIISEITAEDPEIFHLDSSIGYDIVSGVYSKVKFAYKMDKAAYDSKVAQCRTAADELTADIKSASLSEADKVLLAHDRIANLMDYNNAAAANPASATPDDFEITGAFIKHLGVCESYSKAFQYLMIKLGIPCRLNPSKEMGHMWDIVTVDGKDYHVDVTNDDQDSGLFHDLLLRSTNGLRGEMSGFYNHNDYDKTPTDTTYDNYYWKNSKKQFLLKDNLVYNEDYPTGNPDHTHSFKEEIIKKATCTENGEKKLTCSCGYSKTEIIPAAGHKFGAATKENEKPATCTVDGSYDEVATCSVCGETIKTTKTITAPGHKFGAAVKENEKPATCTAAGSYDEVATCSVCGEKTKTTKTIPALGHSFTNYVDNGDGTETAKCDRCDATDKRSSNPAANTKIKTGSGLPIGYNESVHITATAENLPTNYKIVICDKDGKKLAESKPGESKVEYKSGKLTANTDYFVRVVDSKGNTAKDGSGNSIEKKIAIEVSGGFFQIIIAFFKSLFGLLKTYDIG